MHSETAAAVGRHGVALIGAGYWGSRLARNLADAPACSLRWVCDLDAARAAEIGGPVGARSTASLSDVLADPGVDAVVVATPACTHRDVVAVCLDADRHVLVEKPLACSIHDARALADVARERGLVTMCDHTYRFAPAVRAVRALLAADTLGALRSVDSVRTNHNHDQPDVDVFWDLAHHDLSILSFVLPPAARPMAVSARSADLLGVGRAHAGDLTLHLAEGARAHVRVDWCARQKVRTMAFTGVTGALTWNDLAPAGPRLELHASGATRLVSVDHREPLALVVDEFLAAVTEGRAASCGPTEELAVLTLLEAATRSAAAGGTPVPVDVTADDALEVLP